MVMMENNCSPIHTLNKTDGEVQTSICPVNALPIQQFAAQRRIEKETGIGVLTSIMRKVGLIVSLVFLIFLLPFLAIYHLGIYLKEKYTTYFYPDSVLRAIREMKTREETDKFETMQRVLVDHFADIQDLPPEEGAKQLIQGIQDELTDPMLEQKRGARQLLRGLARKESFNPGWIEALTDALIVDTLDFDSKTFPQSLINDITREYFHLEINDLTSLNWEKISRQTKKRTIAANKIEKEVKTFEVSLTELLKSLRDQKKSDPTSANRAFIAALREALSHPVYQALKHDPAQPCVKFLHHLASAIWNETPSMDAYCDVGRSIIRNTSIQGEGDEEEVTGERLAKQLEDSHHKMQKIHYTADGLLAQINYALTHPMQTLGGLASEGGMVRHIPGFFGLDEYDSHGTLSNNPSLQGVTTWVGKGGERVKIHNCYGGSPTIGDHTLAPEFEAVLQAAENNQLAPKALKNKHLPMIVVYNNLQNLDKREGEGPRSRTLILLNTKYPLSCWVTNFSKDSDFYLMKTSESLVWNGEPADFGEKMKAQLERSFDPEEKGHGFYFHGSLEKWEPIFKEVIANATDHFDSLKETERWDTLTPKDLQGAYQEYVYSLLNGIIEFESVKTLMDRSIDLDGCIVMILTACKENIDRGGMENTKYLYLKLGLDEEDWLPLIVGAMHSRALSSRDRVILKSRMHQILSFMKTTSPETFRNNLEKVLVALGYRLDEWVKGEYHPHLEVISENVHDSPIPAGTRSSHCHCLSTPIERP